MPSSSPPRRSLLSIVPPDLEAIDAAWNDEVPTCPGEITERVTKVPSVPSELLARQLMRDAKSVSPHSDDPEESDVFERPDPWNGHAPHDPRTEGAKRQLEPLSPDDIVTYRPPIASALTPGSPFFGSAPAPPHIIDSKSSAPHSAAPAAKTGFELDLEPERFTVHEAPTLQNSLTGTTELEFDPNDSRKSMLERAEQAARLPARSSLDLARRFSSIPARPSDPLQDMRDRHAMGDFSGALEVAEKVLASEPDQKEAFRCAQNCRDVLTDMYASRIGGTQQRALVIMSPDQIRWLSLDHRAGFLLSMVDGISTVDELLDICGMPRLQALRILCSLLDQQVVALEA